MELMGLQNVHLHPLRRQQQPSSGRFTGIFPPAQQLSTLRLRIAVRRTVQTEVGTLKNRTENCDPGFRTSDLRNGMVSIGFYPGKSFEQYRNCELRTLLAKGAKTPVSVPILCWRSKCQDTKLQKFRSKCFILLFSFLRFQTVCFGYLGYFSFVFFFVSALFQILPRLRPATVPWCHRSFVDGTLRWGVVQGHQLLLNLKNSQKNSRDGHSFQFLSFKDTSQQQVVISYTLEFTWKPCLPLPNLAASKPFKSPLARAR